MGILAPLSDFGRGLIELIYPNVCWICRRSLGPEEASPCGSCEGALCTDPHVTCPRCASTVGPYAASSEGCVHCANEKLHFDAAFRLGPYDGLLRDAILRMKYGKDEVLAEVLGEMWARSLATRLNPCPDVIVPVPLHWTRSWKRGFNQSEVLARSLARRLKLPCHGRILRRCRRTPQQAGIQSPTARRDNVRNAFALRPTSNLSGKIVLLVDDVLTTGATANEAARTLRHLQPAQIIVAVLAHDRAR